MFAYFVVTVLACKSEVATVSINVRPSFEYESWSTESYIESNVRMMNGFEWNLEGRSRSLIEVLSRNLHVVTEETHEKHQSGSPVSRSAFEPNTSRIQVESVTALPICSALLHEDR
jgi:hypothetical protein